MPLLGGDSAQLLRHASIALLPILEVDGGSLRLDARNKCVDIVDIHWLVSLDHGRYVVLFFEPVNSGGAFSSRRPRRPQSPSWPCSPSSARHTSSHAHAAPSCSPSRWREWLAPAGCG